MGESRIKNVTAQEKAVCLGANIKRLLVESDACFVQQGTDGNRGYSSPPPSSIHPILYLEFVVHKRVIKAIAGIRPACIVMVRSIQADASMIAFILVLHADMHRCSGAPSLPCYTGMRTSIIAL